MMVSEAYICPVIAQGHHFHTDKTALYVGSSYLSVCCQCGRVQLIRYRGRQETPDLFSMCGADCGPFVK